MVLLEEVKHTIFNIGVLRPLVLISKQKTLVGTSLTKLAMEIFAHPSEVEEINYTLNVFIPKIDKAQNIKKFRPISLCNVAYKTLTKIFALRLRHVRMKVLWKERCWRSLSLQEGFYKEIFFHLTCLSHALKDYFNLLTWLWRIKFDILFNFLEGTFNSRT
ncbi:hypothetical protein CR513_48670, partial [Mucuna pruriens]